jgi:hypothetical protein
MNIPVNAIGSMLPLSPFDVFLNTINTNPYIIGIMMLIMNVGGRFIGMEITKRQEEFLQHPWVRRIVIFIVIFIATRNILVAFWTTLIVILLLGYIFNENSAMCIFGKGGVDGSSCSSKSNVTMTPEERDILQRLTIKAQQTVQQGTDTAVSHDNVRMTDIYAANISLLRR